MISEERKLTKIPEIYCPDCGERFDEPSPDLCIVGSLTECDICESELQCIRIEGSIWCWDFADD